MYIDWTILWLWNELTWIWFGKAFFFPIHFVCFHTGKHLWSSLTHAHTLRHAQFILEIVTYRSFIAPLPLVYSDLRKCTKSRKNVTFKLKWSEKDSKHWFHFLYAFVDFDSHSRCVDKRRAKETNKYWKLNLIYAFFFAHSHNYMRRKVNEIKTHKFRSNKNQTQNENQLNEPKFECGRETSSWTNSIELFKSNIKKNEMEIYLCKHCSK